MSDFSGLSAGEKVLQDDEFTCDLFRFLQLLCEGHNSGLWDPDYLMVPMNKNFETSNDRGLLVLITLHPWVKKDSWAFYALWHFMYYIPTFKAFC